MKQRVVADGIFCRVFRLPGDLLMLAQRREGVLLSERIRQCQDLFVKMHAHQGPAWERIPGRASSGPKNDPCVQTSIRPKKDPSAWRGSAQVSAYETSSWIRTLSWILHSSRKFSKFWEFVLFTQSSESIFLLLGAEEFAFDSKHWWLAVIYL